VTRAVDELAALAVQPGDRGGVALDGGGDDVDRALVRPGGDRRSGSARMPVSPSKKRRTLSTSSP